MCNPSRGVCVILVKQSPQLLCMVTNFLSVRTNFLSAGTNILSVLSTVIDFWCMVIDALSVGMGTGYMMIW